ncbi:MAG: ABC transporter permease [Muribaculaceae bacterium]|nr:ABC transporter permease [Muribaculaceae bacterium]
MLDLIREIIQVLSNNKMRTALTGLSVAWGIFMLIILLGMSRGVYNSFNSGFIAQASNSMQVWSGYTEKPYHGYKQGRAIQLEKDDAPAVTNSNDSHIKTAMPIIYTSSVTISTPRDYMSAGNMEGVYPEYLKAQGREIVVGRFINDIDLKESRKVIVMNKRNVGQLFESAEDAVGQYVSINGLSFQVIGVYHSEWGQEVYLPYSTARMLNGFTDNISSMLVEVQNMSTMEQGEAAEQSVRDVLSKQHDFANDDNSAVWIWNRFTQHMKMSTGLGILNYAIWIIGIFTMLSGIIGVSNIMFVSVKERTHEIGIRRAIGARPRSILGQIIMESVFITGFFGYIGVVLGIGVTELLNHLFADSNFLKDPTVTVAIALQVTVVLIIAGSLAGLFPALKALKVKPVEALRTE